MKKTWELGKGMREQILDIATIAFADARLNNPLDPIEKSIEATVTAELDEVESRLKEVF